jgi:hypothetical protein
MSYVHLRWEGNEKGHAGLKGSRIRFRLQSALLAESSFVRRAIVGWDSYRNGNSEFIQCWGVRVKR